MSFVDFSICVFVARRDNMPPQDAVKPRTTHTKWQVIGGLGQQSIIVFLHGYLGIGWKQHFHLSVGHL